MPWFKVDDKLHDHRKVLRLLRLTGRDPAALGLWVLAGSWSGDNKTDGIVPDYMLDRWDKNAAEHAAQLVRVGLWELVTLDDDEEDAFAFHDWSDYNPVKAEIEEDAAKHARTVALHRDPQLVAAIRERDQSRCRYCGTFANFNDRRSNTGGTYDHVDPEGPNSLANVVVACRGCNRHKGRQTPAEAGMTLLKPGSMGPRNVSRSGQKPDPDTTKSRRGSRPGGAGSGRGRDGSGAEPDLPTDLDTETGGAP